MEQAQRAPVRSAAGVNPRSGATRSDPRIDTRGGQDRYRRRARRLRHVYRNDPGRLHRSLRELSAGDSTPQPAPSLPRSRDGVAEEFGRLVDRQLAGPVLPYSRRVALLREAARRGIGRFEANLIIALVQHRRGGRAGTVVDPKPTMGRRRSLAPAVGAVLLVESLVVVYGWWLLALP